MSDDRPLIELNRAKSIVRRKLDQRLDTGLLGGAQLDQWLSLLAT